MALTDRQQQTFATDYARLAANLLFCYHEIRRLRATWDALGGAVAFNDAALGENDQTAHLTASDMGSGFNTLADVEALISTSGRLTVLTDLAL